MNIHGLTQFVEAMSRNPQLQKDFIALAARYGVDVSAADEMSDADLATVAGGIGEDESLRLQLYTDRQQQTYSTLSNIMKKMSDTSSTIISNIK